MVPVSLMMTRASGKPIATPRVIPMIPMISPKEV